MATNRYQEFQAILEAAEGDFEKFYDKEVGAAGTRVCKEVRNDVTAVKNARKEATGK